MYRICEDFVLERSLALLGSCYKLLQTVCRSDFVKMNNKRHTRLCSGPALLFGAAGSMERIGTGEFA
jgi:hypothetical protein